MYLAWGDAPAQNFVSNWSTFKKKGKQNKQGHNGTKIYGIKFRKIIYLSRGNQDTSIQDSLGLGDPGTSHQGARVTIRYLATVGYDEEVVGQT